MASNYDDDHREPPRARRDRAPYPEQDMDDYDDGPRNRPPPSYEPQAHIPPPPVGDNNLRPAMRRDGSQSRLSPDTRPKFPEEASYLGGRAPDLEAKNRPKDRAFRDMRDGYESDEGETHRKRVGGGRGGQRPREYDDRDDEPRGPPRRPPQGRDAPSYSSQPGQLQRRPSRDDDYDDAPPPRRRRDPYDDDDYPPPRNNRRGDRRAPEVEYGSEPIPARERRSDRRPPPRRRDDYYDDDDEDDYRPPRRRRSYDEHKRPSRRDEDYFSDDRDAPRRRRDRDRYDDDSSRRRESSRSRRRYDDDDDNDDRRDRNKRKSKPTEMKIGGFDVGSLVDKGQKHWATLAPIVAPIVMSMVRSKMGGGGGGGGGSSGRSRSSRR